MRKPKTLEEQLAAVQEAIEKIELHGQAYVMDTDDSRVELKRASLPALYKREARLLVKLDRQNGGGISYVG